MKKLVLLLVLACMLAACAPAPAAQPTLTPRPVVQGYRDFPSTMEGNGIALVPGLQVPQLVSHSSGHRIQRRGLESDHA